MGTQHLLAESLKVTVILTNYVELFKIPATENRLKYPENKWNFRSALRANIHYTY